MSPHKHNASSKDYYNLKTCNGCPNSATHLVLKIIGIQIEITNTYNAKQ